MYDHGFMDNTNRQAVCESSQVLVSVCIAYDFNSIIVTLIMAIDLYESIMHHLNVLNVLNVSNNDGV